MANYGQERKIVYWLLDDVAKRKHDIKWCEFENSLGQLRCDKIIKKWGDDRFDRQCLKDSVDDIRGFFFEWINTIGLSETRRIEPYMSLIDGKRDIALSFNYTETLECVYEMETSNICYIHGQRETDPVLQKEKAMRPFGKGNSSLVVGFGPMHVKNSREADKKSMLMGLYKHTKSIIYQHRTFFDKIAHSGIKEIYSLGFSFAEVDLPYIKKICDVLRYDNHDRDITWFISPYGKVMQRVRDEIYFRKCIRRAGFRGRIRKLKSDT